MKKSKKICSSILACTIGVILLAGSINAQMLSGYGSLKNAVKNTIELDNATVEMNYKYFNDNRLIENTTSIGEADYKNNKWANHYSYNMSDDNYKYSRFNDNGLSISQYDTDGEVNYNVYENLEVDTPEYLMMNIPKGMIKVVELCSDALMGNAKDYFVSEEIDGKKTINASFDKTQIPEVASAMLDVVIADAKRYEELPSDREDLAGVVLNQKVTSGYINYVVVNATVNENEILNDMVVKFEIILNCANGREIPVTMEMAFKVTNVGTTVIDVPNVSKDDENVEWRTYNGGNTIVDVSDTLSDESRVNYDELSEKTSALTENIQERLNNGEKLSDEELERLLDMINDMENTIVNGEYRLENISDEEITTEVVEDEPDVETTTDVLEETTDTVEGVTQEEVAEVVEVVEVVEVIEMIDEIETTEETTQEEIETEEVSAEENI